MGKSRIKFMTTEINLTVAQAFSDTSSPHSAKQVFTKKKKKKVPRLTFYGKKSFILRDNRTDPTLPIQLLNTQ